MSPSPARKHRDVAVFILLAAATRFVVLFHSQAHVHSDEAIIGLMGKHVLEGRYFPFYMYGQPYNAGAAWEAYLAAIPFQLFGVGVVQLKCVVVIASLVCLVLFYRMVDALYDRRTTILASLMFAMSPSLLAWHFQVRGYSWYLIAIPLLTASFFAIAAGAAGARRLFVFGVVSGVTLWSLELALFLVGAYWILLTLHGSLSAKAATVGAVGLLIGYSPALVFNMTHDFANWRMILAEKTGSGIALGPSAVAAIVLDELPKFFGTDTVLWYHAETPLIGYVGYAIAIIALLAAILPFVRRPSKLRTLRGETTDEHKDLALVLLTFACFATYVVARFRVPGYLLGSCFFLSALIGRLAARGLTSARRSFRAWGVAIVAASVLAGCVALVTTYRRNEIETLTLDQNGGLVLAGFPGADIEGVQRHLREHRIDSVWTTLSFVYPLIFESGETLAASDAIFGWGRPVYPPSVPKREPSRSGHQVYVLESVSPFREPVIARCAERTGAPPLVSAYGSLSVIEERSP